MYFILFIADIIIISDSMLKTQGGRKCKVGMLHPYNIVSSFKGQTIHNIYNKIKSNCHAVYSKLGSVIFIFIGTNDLNILDFNFADFRTSYLIFLDYIRSLFPLSDIVVFSLISRSYNRYCKNRYCLCKYCNVITRIGLNNMNSRIRLANNVIKDIVNSYSNLFYLDIFNDFNKNINMLGMDGLHPSRAGNMYIDTRIRDMYLRLMH